MVVLGLQLDLMILEVFSNLNDSIILWSPFLKKFMPLTVVEYFLCVCFLSSEIILNIYNVSVHIWKTDPHE